MRPNKIIYCWLLLCAFTLTGCAQSQTSKTETELKSDRLTKFPTPELPLVLGQDPVASAKYLVSHYWDKYPFTDTSLISNTKVTEQGFADFLSLLRYVDAEVASESLSRMMQSAEADSAMYDHFIALADRYLYNPSSPYRNGEHYLPILRHIMNSRILEDIEKIAPKYQLDMLLKNRIGDRAIDFAYTLPDGRSGTLYGIKADYLLLFFNNPDCDLCNSYKEYISTSPSFTKWLSKLGGSSRLKVLAFYPDKDLDLWRDATYPKGWINCRNSTKSFDDIYDIRAIPTLYLLDKDKKVLLKDSYVEQVEHYLKQMLDESGNASH